MSKEIPAGAPLQLVSDYIPDSFSSTEEAIVHMVEALQKGDFDSVHLHMNDGMSSVNLGYIHMDKSTEDVTDQDKTRLAGLAQSGAGLLSRMPLPLALHFLAEAYKRKGDPLSAAALSALSGVNPFQGSDGNEEEGNPWEE